MPVLKQYQSMLVERGYQADAAQLAGAQALSRCAQDWAVYVGKRSNALKKLIRHPPIPQGVYLYGGVGRGKSFLMDCFYRSVPIRRKTRLHFHEFMREVHRQLNALQGIADPLDELGRRMAIRYRLLCFDEFHISNITDAMLLQRLLEAFKKYGIGLVVTSNFHPEALYPNGLLRERILPAMALLKGTLQIVQVDNGVDYRSRTMHSLQLYHTPLGDAADAALRSAFEQLAKTRESPKGLTTLVIERREITALRKSGGVIWFDFKTLCAGPRSYNDYLEIASQFHTVILSGVPQMFVRHANEARRFTWLVDVLYDRHVKLIMSAAVPVEKLYTEGPLAHEFPRTVSRLQEMQGKAYLALPKREVDTSLV